ncbi:MAG: tRNA pseudouridine(38-40) synthase TruA, partial [Candidatus Ureaplasma intestinipullorum]|nr:tRNA pseudouridine(38-40) synthase TruA [Candidatus Ureaplasma intestinipullorum]
MNYKLVISYNGARFYGFAKQLNLRTVQSTIENAIDELFGIKLTVFGSGRTDRYVHAIEQVVSFKSKNLNIDPKSMINAINSKLDNDIRVLDCIEVPES